MSREGESLKHYAKCTRVYSIRHQALQPVLYPAECTYLSHGLPASPGRYCGRQCRRPCWSLDRLCQQSFPPSTRWVIPQMGHSVTEGNQVGQAGPAFHEPMLAGPDPLVVPYLLWGHTQDIHKCPPALDLWKYFKCTTWYGWSSLSSEIKSVWGWDSLSKGYVCYYTEYEMWQGWLGM